MKIIESNNNDIKSKKLGDIIKENKKSKLLVSEASNTGEYPFYNSSQKLTMSHNNFLLDGVKIVLSTGGDYSSLHLTDGKFAHSSDTYVIESNDNEILTEYIYYFLVINKNMLDRCFEGTKLKHLNKKMLKKEYVSYPDLEIQKKIITLLNSHNTYLQSIQTLISKMEQRNQYYFDKVFLGDYVIQEEDVFFTENVEKEKINLNKKDVEINSRFSKKKIPEIISLKKGGSVKKEDFNYEGDGTRYLRTSDVWEDSSSTKDAVYYEGNTKGLVYKTKKDWIVCFDGYNRKPKKGTLGLVTNQGEGYCSGELHIVKGVDGVSMEFVNIALLRSSYFQDLICRYGEGTTVKHAGKHVKTIELPYIPYEDQVVLKPKIKEMLNEVDLLKELYSKEKQVFQWLCEKLVSGEYKIEE